MAGNKGKLRAELERKALGQRSHILDRVYAVQLYTTYGWIVKQTYDQYMDAMLHIVDRMTKSRQQFNRFRIESTIRDETGINVYYDEYA